MGAQPTPGGSRGQVWGAWLGPALVCAILIAQGAWAGPNGFDLSHARVDPHEIQRGGPPRDAIPALDTPRMVRAKDAPWPDETMVVGVQRTTDDGRSEARAYPLDVLVWHELVNDVVAGQPILISYCPLCGSAMVFDRGQAGLATDLGADADADADADAKPLRFGVSGLLYRSDLLMFDRESESLWAQISGEAVTGQRAGQRLKLVRSSLEHWASWRARHPDTLVLSPQTGHQRDYGRSPYGDYARSRRLLFAAQADPRLHPKTRTLGLRTKDGTQARAYPWTAFEGRSEPVEEDFAGRSVRITRSKERNGFIVEAPADIDVIETFWFAWMAFHPHSSVWTAEPER